MQKLHFPGQCICSVQRHYEFCLGSEQSQLYDWVEGIKGLLKDEAANWEKTQKLMYTRPCSRLWSVAGWQWRRGRRGWRGLGTGGRRRRIDHVIGWRSWSTRSARPLRSPSLVLLQVLPLHWLARFPKEIEKIKLICEKCSMNNKLSHSDTPTFHHTKTGVEFGLPITGVINGSIVVIVVVVGTGHGSVLTEVGRRLHMVRGIDSLVLLLTHSVVVPIQICRRMSSCKNQHWQSKLFQGV